jgi:biopolymer transport protein ExbD
MKFSAARKNRLPIINITSLIDVLFLLVIFLLLSAKFEQEGGIGVDLPQGKSREVPETRVFDLTITHDGSMFLEKEKVTLVALAERIKKLRESAKDPVLVIRADKDVSWDHIVRVTDTARLVGQAKVNFKIKP